MNLPFQLSRRRILYLLGFFILSLSALTAVAEHGVFHLWRLKSEKTKLDQENYRLQKENQSLRQRVSKLRNDNFYLEKWAREDLNLVRPGEIIYRFPSSASGKSSDGTLNDDRPGSRPSTAQSKRR
jgi:cell division protein FtsB